MGVECITDFIASVQIGPMEAPAQRHDVKAAAERVGNRLPLSEVPQRAMNEHDVSAVTASFKRKAARRLQRANPRARPLSRRSERHSGCRAGRGLSYSGRQEKLAASSMLPLPL